MSGVSFETADGIADVVQRFVSTKHLTPYYGECHVTVCLHMIAMAMSKNSFEYARTSEWLVEAVCHVDGLVILSEPALQRLVDFPTREPDGPVSFVENFDPLDGLKKHAESIRMSAARQHRPFRSAAAAASADDDSAENELCGGHYVCNETSRGRFVAMAEREIITLGALIRLAVAVAHWSQHWKRNKKTIAYDDHTGFERINVAECLQTLRDRKIAAAGRNSKRNSHRDRFR